MLTPSVDCARYQGVSIANGAHSRRSWRRSGGNGARADTVIRLNLNAISTIGVVGLGTIGSQELALWQRSGHQTVGYDISEDQVEAARDIIKANSGPAPRLTTRITDLNEADVLILCLPNLAPTGENSMAAFDHFSGDAGALDEKERLWILASTLPIGFTRELAVSWARKGIRVNAIAPGYFHSRLADGAIAMNEASIKASSPIPRVGDAGELKGVAVFLAADASNYITGQTIVVDGGRTIA